MTLWRYRLCDPTAHVLTSLTDTIRGGTGHEQRRKLRLSPRHTINTAFHVERAKRSRLEHELASVAEWDLPLSMFAQRVTGIAAGSGTIAADTAYPFASRAVLADYAADRFEVVAIDSIAPGVLTLDGTTAEAWASALLIPLRTARLMQSPAIGLFTDDIAYGDAVFELTEVLDWPEYTWAQTYRGLPVLPVEPDTFTDPVLEVRRDFTVIDVESGFPAVYDLPGVPMQTLQIGYAAYGIAAIRNLYGMTYALAGRLASVWISASARDFIPLAAAGSTLDVQDTGLVAVQDTRRDIRIKYADGSKSFHRITGVTNPSAGVQRLALDSPVTGSVTGAVISWLWLGRQSTDVNALAYWTDDVAETTLQFEGFNHDL